VHRILLLILAPFLVATAIGLVVLWPESSTVKATHGVETKQFKATVTQVVNQDCPDVPGQENFSCSKVTVELSEGEDAGKSFSFDSAAAPQTRAVREGDHVIVGTALGVQGVAWPPSRDWPFRCSFS
jgi:hypothetical protein